MQQQEMVKIRMKPKTPEKHIENSILSFLKMNRILAWKNESVGVFDPKRGKYRLKRGAHRKVGVSDILGIFQGQFLAIEVKTQKGKATPAQAEFLEEVNQNGGIGFVARSIDEVKERLKL